MKKLFCFIAAFALISAVLITGCQKKADGPEYAGAAGTGIIASNASADAEVSGGKAAPSANAMLPEVTAALTSAGLPPAREAIAPIDFTLPLVGGGTQKLSDLKGTVVLLNFWATWCPPCRAEMPSMETVYQQLKDKGFTILAVDLGEKESEVASFLQTNKLTFPAALDASGQVGGQYGARSIPTTYIIDRRGLIVSRLVGSIEWNRPAILKAFEVLLNEPVL